MPKRMDFEDANIFNTVLGEIGENGAIDRSLGSGGDSPITNYASIGSVGKGKKGKEVDDSTS